MTHDTNDAPQACDCSTERPDAAMLSTSHRKRLTMRNGEHEYTNTNRKKR
jgi:hypothetical protein